MKWAGGKEKELTHILPNIPEQFDRYIEPFIGGGAVYFAMDKERMCINDKFTELTSLYTFIKTNDQRFFEKLDSIYANWLEIENFVLDKELMFVNKYKQYSEDHITKEELDDFIVQFLHEYSSVFEEILATSFNVKQDKFIAELKRNLTGKTKRMKKIEGEKGKLPSSDIVDNIETAFKSAYYMYLRYLYNYKAELNLPTSDHIAVFYFIREYCYASMFRYNKEGKFNVPYGGISYNRKAFNKKINYMKSNELRNHLQRTEIYNLDFEQFFEEIEITGEDFIFLDPPYDSDFSDYAGMSFTAEDQTRLANYLYNTEAKWMLVIKNTELIQSLYIDRGFEVLAFDKKYLVSFQNRNDKNTEHLLIKNY
ncbi:hypothetical protein BKP35_07440 [Anaerobacillus arseniciselenatis]|uniref:site-specific DNA-methyltransferase (adenine-specific) n=1 Tax=Anaerobacillus arseniciselenatis TaxID=85682 RepID=A0A1S2LNT3_9BACI|nr:DNA adenine methylase [Anaerobacillus arseniciselenatis]OIJ14182.1 hypothetical protein BKP35_07440 [Anaerobacillus arseniciselenatis]